MDELDFIRRVLGAFWHTDQREDLFYRVDAGVIQFYVICNDVFYWATADLEQITTENIPELERAFQDSKTLVGNYLHGSLLFCARMRKMRPQGAMYNYIPQELWTQFDNCGPKRETGLQNPTEQPTTP